MCVVAGGVISTCTYQYKVPQIHNNFVNPSTRAPPFKLPFVPVALRLKQIRSLMQGNGYVVLTIDWNNFGLEKNGRMRIVKLIIHRISPVDLGLFSSFVVVGRIS